MRRPLIGKTESAIDILAIAMVVALGVAMLVGLLTANGASIGHWVPPAG